MIVCSVLAATGLVASLAISILAWLGMLAHLSMVMIAPLGILCIGLGFFTLPSRTSSGYNVWMKGIRARWQCWMAVPVFALVACGYLSGMASVLSALNEDGYVRKVGDHWALTRDRDANDVIRELTPEEARHVEVSGTREFGGIMTVFYAIHATLSLVWLAPEKKSGRQRRA